MSSKNLSIYDMTVGFKGILLAKLQENLNAVGEEIVESAKENLARNGSIDTGALRDSIKVASAGSGDGPSPLQENLKLSGMGISAQVSVVATAEYAPYVEYGTGIYAEGGDGRKDPWSFQDKDGKWWTMAGAHPKPFMRPAVAEHEADVYKAADDAWNYAVKAVTGR